MAKTYVTRYVIQDNTWIPWRQAT